MFHKSIYTKSILALSLAVTLCLNGCASTQQETITDTAETTPATTTTDPVETESPSILATAETTAETSASSETATTNSDTIAADAQKQPALVAYATDVEATLWLQNNIDIRFPEEASPSMTWDYTLPITLWGETDMIATIPAPLTVDNIKAAGYDISLANGSDAATISAGDTNSYVIGYASENATKLDYTVVALNTQALLGTESATLENVLNVLGVPSFGFAYSSLEVRYYYLYEDYYLEVSMTKSGSDQSIWAVSEVMYYDASAFLNHDFELEIEQIKESAINGFCSDYLIPSGF